VEAPESASIGSAAADVKNAVVVAGVNMVRSVVDVSNVQVVAYVNMVNERKDAVRVVDRLSALMTKGGTGAASVGGQACAYIKSDWISVSYAERRPHTTSRVMATMTLVFMLL